MYTFPFVPFRYSKTATVGMLIIILCLIPSSEFAKLGVRITFGDVIVHFFMFLGFSSALFFDMSSRRKNVKKLRIISLTFLLSIGLGITTELLQHFITSLHRTGSIVDLMFDVLGTLAGIGFMSTIGRRFVPAP
ncbi:MAG TPA: VanZ family protein [Bacteroidales bacterium]|nr:VanZ family protein [Bacteroidales bacterium]